MSDDLERAFEDFVDAIRVAADGVRAHPFYKNRENRASAHAFLASMVLSRLEEDVVFDADLPYFRILDPRIREGGDNADQRYLIASLRGGETYRIWGHLGSARRLDLQIYAGDPYIAGSGGRSASFLDFEEIHFADDGSFEVIASPDRQGGSWLENPIDATRVLVRQVYSTWSDEPPGEVHIDRVGHEGDLKPVLTDDAMTERLTRAAHSLTTHARVWPEMVRVNYMSRREPNSIAPPFDPGTVGGVPGRWMASGTFDLDPDHALVVTTWPAGGNYQGIQLLDLWFSSLEYANRQTSLTADQAHLDADGAYRFVIAGRDPGVANWLDTTGRHRGVILLRYDGTQRATFDTHEHPLAERVALDDLATHFGF
jgi:hypothetical protein